MSGALGGEMVVDPWVHPNSKEWTATFALARQLRWDPPRVSSSHPSYRLICPGGICKVRAYGTTGAAGDSAAITARNKIRSCPHIPDSMFVKVQRHLDSAAQLLDTVELQIALSQAQTQVLEILDEIELNLDGSENLLRLYCETDDHRLRILGQLNDETEIQSPRENLSEARRELKSVRTELKELRSHGQKWVDLKGQIMELKQRLLTCSELLNSQTESEARS